MGRSPCCDKANVKRGPWSPQEDATLRNYIQEHGTAGNWIALPRKAGLHRCGKSCRLRWLNYLRPDIKLGGFTEEEDNMIYSLYSTIGSRWSVIAAKMPGRTDNDVKNHWNTKLKKKVLSGNVCLLNDTPPPATSTNRRGAMIHNIYHSSTDGNQFDHQSLSKGKTVSDFSNSPSNHHSITYSDEFPNYSASSSLEIGMAGDSLLPGYWGVEELVNLFDLQYGSLYDPLPHEFGSKTQ